MDCIIPGLYALVGAAACLSGVTRMTVSLVVIMFELTGAMTYALPIMMAVMISKFVGDAFSPDAFFNKLIELNEHPYLDNKKDYNTFGTAADIADRYLETIDVNDLNDVESLRRKVEILAALGYSDGGLPIVDRGILVGYIASNELEHALGLAEKKHPECICLFRNRASSNVPATEIITSLNDLESQANATTNHQEPPKFEERRRREWPREDSRDDLTYDNDMQGYDKPVRDAPGRPGDSRGYDTNKSNGAHSGRSGYDGFAGDDEASLLYSNRPRMLVRSDSRVSSTTTGDIVYDPARTMDCTPFTDQVSTVDC
jgi:chloride channel 3/4/5